jgi:FXSXX-COOH protein
VDSIDGPIRGNLDQPLIPDLGRVSLEQVADRTGYVDDPVARVVDRFMDSMESPSRVPVTTFNSAI